MAFYWLVALYKIIDYLMLGNISIFEESKFKFNFTYDNKDDLNQLFIRHN